jgi:hypothetical protein
LPLRKEASVKVSVLFQKKVSGSEPYSSEGYHVALETEPPPEVAGDRERLSNYVMALAAEARARVEEALERDRVERQEREPETPAPTTPSSRAAPSGHASHRPGLNGGAPRRPPSAAAARPVGNGNGNGRSNSAPREGGVGASFKQIQFARSLGARAGYSVAQLSALCEESFGRQLEQISKSDASALIEQLRAEVRG